MIEEIVRNAAEEEFPEGLERADPSDSPKQGRSKFPHSLLTNYHESQL
jgi:hypothetical protein